MSADVAAATVRPSEGRTSCAFRIWTYNVQATQEVRHSKLCHDQTLIALFRPHPVPLPEGEGAILGHSAIPSPRGRVTQREGSSCPFAGLEKASQGYVSFTTVPPTRDQSSLTGTGFTFHISSQYSLMERSEENFPVRAVLRIDIRAQRGRSWNAALAVAWQST